MRRQLLQQRRERVGHVIIPRRLVLRPVFGLVLLLLLVTVLVVVLLRRKVVSVAPLRVRFAEPEAEPKGLVLEELVVAHDPLAGRTAVTGTQRRGHTPYVLWPAAVEVNWQPIGRRIREGVPRRRLPGLLELAAYRARPVRGGRQAGSEGRAGVVVHGKGRVQKEAAVLVEDAHLQQIHDRVEGPILELK